MASIRVPIGLRDRERREPCATFSAIPQPASKIGGDSHSYGTVPSGNSCGRTTVPPTQNVHRSGNVCSESVGDCRAMGDSVTMVQQTRRWANLPTGILGTNPRGFDPGGIDAKKGNDGRQGVGTDICAVVPQAPPSADLSGGLRRLGK